MILNTMYYNGFKLEVSYEQFEDLVKFMIR